MASTAHVALHSRHYTLAIIDELTLTSWGSRVCAADASECDSLAAACATMTNSTHGFGNANDLCGCRHRVEDYFIFFQDDSIATKCGQQLAEQFLD